MGCMFRFMLVDSSIRNEYISTHRKCMATHCIFSSSNGESIHKKVNGDRGFSGFEAAGETLCLT